MFELTLYPSTSWNPWPRLGTLWLLKSDVCTGHGASLQTQRKSNPTLRHDTVFGLYNLYRERCWLGEMMQHEKICEHTWLFFCRWNMMKPAAILGAPSTGIPHILLKFHASFGMTSVRRVLCLFCLFCFFTPTLHMPVTQHLRPGILCLCLPEIIKKGWKCRRLNLTRSWIFKIPHLWNYLKQPTILAMKTRPRLMLSCFAVENLLIKDAEDVVEWTVGQCASEANRSVVIWDIIPSTRSLRISISIITYIYIYVYMYIIYMYIYIYICIYILYMTK